MPSRFETYWKAHLDFLDVHYHANPDLYLRRYDALEIGEIYGAHGGAVVLKNHLGGASEVAAMARSRGCHVFGSVVLNDIAGGITLKTVKQQLCYHGDDPDRNGRMLVHLPTNVPHAHKSVLARQYYNSHVSAWATQPTCICDAAGRLLPEILALFDFAQENPIVISTGHASRREVDMLIEIAACRSHPVRLMLNQPANPITGMTAQDLLALAREDWLFIEQTSLTVLLGYQDEEDFYDVLREVPNLIYSSDLGQTSQMLPAEWIAWSNRHFEAAGLSPERRAEIRLETPLRMLAP
ncbi:MAG TPA: DUF6282 family protein [Dongiaceae bacterium]|jgi:hypothetical protein|nr:DUF6282 family protein [Dongiaceae bacterium]